MKIRELLTDDVKNSLLDAILVNVRLLIEEMNCPTNVSNIVASSTIRLFYHVHFHTFKFPVDAQKSALRSVNRPNVTLAKLNRQS